MMKEKKDIIIADMIREMDKELKALQYLHVTGGEIEWIGKELENYIVYRIAVIETIIELLSMARSLEANMSVGLSVEDMWDMFTGPDPEGSY